jgi:hypothetical protein
MKAPSALAMAAGVIWLLFLAPAQAQDTTEYMGTTSQSAGQSQGRSLGSAIANQLRGAGQTIGSGDTAPSYDSNSADQGQAVDSDQGSAPTGPTGGSEDNYDN